MAVSRIQEHKLIMSCIYDALIYISMGDEFSVESLMEGIFEIPYDEIPFFSKEIVVKSLVHIDEITEAFQVNMPKWKFSRLSTLERAILLMSYTHYKLSEEVDKKVVIDTAVRLSKEYLDKDDYKFVNAVLDNTL